MYVQHMRGHGSRSNILSKTTSTFLFENLANCLEISSVLTVDVFSLALSSRLYLNGLPVLDFFGLESAGQELEWRTGEVGAND